MLKTELKEHLRTHLCKDAIYTEKSFSQNDGMYISCSVWSASAGYTVTYTRKVTSQSNRVMKVTRSLFLEKVNQEANKFKSRFDYTEENDSVALEALNDNFDYDEC